MYNYTWFKRFMKKYWTDGELNEFDPAVRIKEFFEATGTEDAFTSRTLLQSIILPRDEDYRYLRRSNCPQNIPEDFNATWVKMLNLPGNQGATLLTSKSIHPNDCQLGVWYHLPKFLGIDERKILNYKLTDFNEHVDYYDVQIEVHLGTRHNQIRKYSLGYLFRDQYFELAFRLNEVV